MVLELFPRSCKSRKGGARQWKAKDLPAAGHRGMRKVRAEEALTRSLRSELVIFSPVQEIGKEFHPHPNPLLVREGEGIGIISQSEMTFPTMSPLCCAQGRL